MSNGLTGDFDAVLEVSGGTFDRLAASMHQNGFADPSNPSIPHVTHFRLGSDEDGPRGSVSAQIGVPHIELIHGARDRFRVELDLRARYRADPGSAPLADVIHGTVRAEYRIRDVDGRCLGWETIADEYLSIQLVKGSVSFEGTVHDLSPALAVVTLSGEEEIKEEVTRQLEVLLATKFAPTPQPIGKRFRHGIRSLALGPGPGESAVAIPVGLTTETPAGDPDSIEELFLANRDFGLAVSSEYVMARVRSQLDPLVGLQRDLHVHGDAGLGGGLEIDYHVRLDSAGADWLGALAAQPEKGLIRVSFTGSGWATRLYKSGIFNIGTVTLDDLRMTFAAHQLLVLSFDPGGERIVVSAFGPPSVTVNYGGPFGGEVRPRAQNEISAHIQNALGPMLGQAQGLLNTLTGPAQKAPLLDQLRRIDGVASVRFDEAVFRADGVVVRGAIGLTRRHVPHVVFERTQAGNGFDAIESWIPGGRIDTFEWTWRWFTNPIQGPPGPAGDRIAKHEFLLERPHGGKTKFGMSLVGDTPLPGLDGSGVVCLTIKGRRVDAVTGRLVPMESEKRCEQFGYEFHMPIEVAPWVPWCDPLLGPEEGPFPEIGILQVGISPAPFNTLVLFLGLEWNRDLVSVLISGLDVTRRVGAGLLVLLLFQEGAMSAGGAELGAELKTLAAKLEAPLLATEDVGLAWSKVLAIPEDRGEGSWRLIRPDGVMAWSTQGFPDGEELGSILDTRLADSAPPVVASARPAVAIGLHLPLELAISSCPPVPLSRPGLGGTTLVFVQKDHSASLARLEQVARDQREPDPDVFVAAVVVGADLEDVERLQAQLGLDMPIFPDPTGALTRQAGVRFWPTTLTLDDLGRLTGFEMGVGAERGRQ